MAFCARYSIDYTALGSAVSGDLHSLGECFIDYLRFSRSPPLLSSTIDSYVTHVSDWFLSTSLLSSPYLSVRSPRTKLILAGYSNIDASLRPLRDKVAIPLTYPLLCALIDIIQHHYSLPSQSHLRLVAIASYTLGYAISARPSEYLLTSTSDSRLVPLRSQINSDLSFFVWGAAFFTVTTPLAFPPGIPDFFSTVIEYQKNDKRGKGGPRAIARCTAVPPQYDCLSCLFAYLRRFPPLPASPLLSGLGTQVKSSDLLPFLKDLARTYDLDPARMKMHSSVRSGALVALENETDAVKQRQGCWSSTEGMCNYLRGTLQHASHVSSLLHDSSLCPISITQMTFNTSSTTLSNNTTVHV